MSIRRFSQQAKFQRGKKRRRKISRVLVRQRQTEMRKRKGKH